MTLRHQKAFSAIALFLIFSVTQVYVQANLLASPARSENTGASTLLLSGKLATRGGGLITLNGNQVGPGATILTGAQLQTPENVGATVQLGKLGKVDLAPGTNLMLSFGPSNVDVRLSTGYAILTTLKGIDGSMTTPDGVVSKSDSTKVSTVVGQDDQDKNKKKKGGTVIPDSGVGAGSDTGQGILGGLTNNAARTFGLIVLGGAIIGAILVSIHQRGRGLNPSPARPSF